jgi:hypothetical protein
VWKTVAGCVLILGLAPGAADACGILRDKHAADPSERGLDTRAPAQVVARVAKVTRGQGPRLRDPGVGPSSCDDLGFIEIELVRFEDDRTPPERLGYRIGPPIGTPPATLRPATDAYRLLPGQERRVVLVWIDGATDEQEPFDFTVVLTAVDSAGNESVASEPVRAVHPGRQPGQER